MIKKILLMLILVVSLSACGQIEINENTTVEDLQGRPVALLIGGTFCPHCQTAAPTYEEQVWEKYHKDAYVIINVIDGQDGKRFDIANVPQGYSANLRYEVVTGEECGYVPSWVVLDSEGKVALSSCGNEKTMDDLENKLKELVNA